MLITQTPLRISFAGGGTDFADFYTKEPGYVLSTAIDKYVYVIVKERFDDKIYINYTKKEIVDRVEKIQHDLVREALKRAGLFEGVEITTLADVPSEGSGLGSSSSLTVGLLNAFYMYQGEQRTAEELAREACEIEIEIVGKPIGKQDQYIAAYGNLRAFSFLPGGHVEIGKVPIPNGQKRDLDANTLLFFTNLTRKSETILSQQRANIQDRMEVLHKIAMLGLEAKGALWEGDLDRIGTILNRGWHLKKDLANPITNREIDGMYERALEAGALGGKISGAGGGGFLMLYCPPERQGAVRRALQGYRELPFHFERDGSKVIFNMRRYEWK